MVNTQRPDDNIIGDEPDVEGHRHILNVDAESDTDTEGHRHILNADTDADDDVEGHRNILN